MRKYAVVLAAAVLFIFAFSVSVFANDIAWEDISRGNLNLRTVLVDPDNPLVIYLGSDRAVLKSEDGGVTWRNSLFVRGQNRAVNFLLFGPQDKSSLYAATGNGLFSSSDKGRNWKKIFQGRDYAQRNCLSLAVLPSVIYLGTEGGLFTSTDKGRSWRKEAGQIGNSAVKAFAFDLRQPQRVYLATSDAVFAKDKGTEPWKRVFIFTARGNGEEIEEQPDEQEEPSHAGGINYISVDAANPDCLYLATARGIYRSPDKGQNWEAFSDYGLFSRDVKFIFSHVSFGLYALTKTAAFEYQQDRWQELTFCLTAKEMRFLALDKQGNLYLVSERGLFRSHPENSYQGAKEPAGAVVLPNADEPDIRRVQEAAIAYAEVSPEKIKHWRKQAAKKALLPQLSVGIDRNTADLWHWEGGSTTRTDDDILRRGRDSVDWDVTLSWNLGELIWNDDQTNIDVRSRLMVELRDDILDEVTKLYFERSRLKLELENLSIEDRRRRSEKELKLTELSASLDALTGGYFSQYCRK